MNTPIVTLPHEKFTQWPTFTEAEEAAVLRVLRDGNVSTHPVIRELEAAFRDFSGRKYALAHCNGTTALLAAFHSLGLEPGDEVLVPSGTFWASVLPTLWCGLVPVFCDSEAETLAIDAEDAARRITPRTRAMVIVHMWGLPCQVRKLQALANTHGLKIVEDASHAHGASVDGVPCGRFGDVSVFSLQGDKLVPAGEGGVLLTDDEAIYKKAVCLGDITRIIQLPMPEMRFAATSFGVKTRIAPMSAALGLAMLARLPETNLVRNRNHLALSASLEALGLDCFLPPAGVERVYFEFMVRHRDPGFDTARFCERLRELGCKASAPRYPVLHQQPFFTEGHWRSVGRFSEGFDVDPCAVHLPRIERENGRLIRLPNFCHPESAAIIEQYAEAFRVALN